jgi:hypothetical protein
LADSAVASPSSTFPQSGNGYVPSTTIAKSMVPLLNLFE